MRGSVAVMAIALAALPVAAPAGPASVADIVRSAGLLGTWAVDCNDTATPNNPHVTDAVADGVVTESHDLGSEGEINRYRILAAKRLKPTQLSLRVIFQPGSPREQHQHLILALHDNTRRTIFNKPASGTVQVKGGVAVGYEVKTPLLRKCEP